ncbi:MAG: 6-phosphogluconolactonase, partial [Stellaceae bacterium]
MPQTQTRIEAVSDAGALAQAAARWITGLAGGEAGRFSICLSGGSTPRRLYQLLATSPRLETFPWPNVHWFWG